MEDAIKIMKRASDQIRDAIRVEAEFRKRIERQNALISVALGYIKSDRPGVAAFVLASEGEDA
jgi:hypothetical protein